MKFLIKHSDGDNFERDTWTLDQTITLVMPNSVDFYKWIFLHVIIIIFMIKLRGFATRQKCLMKSSFEIETKQKVSWRFCEHYVSTPVTEQLLKWKHLWNNSGNYWYLHNLRKKMLYISDEICSFEYWRSPLRHNFGLN